jgi:cytoskeletal protein CcmA (bactofilin family)
MALFSKDQPPARPPIKIETPTGTTTSFSGTYLGPDIVIDGTVSGSENVLIEGTVRGKINLGNDLQIGTRARVEANVHAKTVTIEGKLTGDVSADDRVELVMTSTVDGNIKAPKIIVAEGAKFRGSVDMGSPRPREHGETAMKSK